MLIDLWAKLDQPRAVYSDLTRVGFVGEQRAREVRRDLPDRGRGPRRGHRPRANTPLRPGEPLQGWQVDQAARDVIEQAGYGEYFVHRTGHSIGQETHGNGANMDNLETHEERRVLRRTCFSIEPGIYLPEFGVRSEVNVFVDAAGPGPRHRRRIANMRKGDFVASANTACTSAHEVASHGAIDRAGAGVAIPLTSGCPCGSTKPGASTAAPVSTTAASGSAARQSATEPTATMRSPDTATASARGVASSMVITVAAVRILSGMAVSVPLTDPAGPSLRPDKR